MSNSSSSLIAVLVSAVGGGGILAGATAYLKDRKKDNATAKMTDVQALQQEVVLLTQVCEFLRKENNQLRADYIVSEEQRRTMRARMGELEAELQKVRNLAAHTQDQCDMLSRQLREIVSGEDEK